MCLAEVRISWQEYFGLICLLLKKSGVKSNIKMRLSVWHQTIDPYRVMPVVILTTAVSNLHTPETKHTIRTEYIIFLY